MCEANEMADLSDDMEIELAKAYVAEALRRLQSGSDPSAEKYFVSSLDLLQRTREHQAGHHPAESDEPPAQP
jgi:hypothetical protein